jgi:hypothetical protein
VSDNEWFNHQPLPYRIAWFKDALERASLQDPPPKDMKQAVEELQRLIFLSK